MSLMPALASQRAPRTAKGRRIRGRDKRQPSLKVFRQSFQERQKDLVVFVFRQRAITGLIVDLAHDQIGQR